MGFKFCDMRDICREKSAFEKNFLASLRGRLMDFKQKIDFFIFFEIENFFLILIETSDHFQQKIWGCGL